LVRALCNNLPTQKVVKHCITDSTLKALQHILSDLHIILYDFLDKTERYLRKLEDKLRLINEGRFIISWWSQYLVILKQLKDISKLFNNSDVFRQKLSQ